MLERNLYNSTHVMFGEAVSTFADREVDPHLERFRAQGGFDRSMWTAAGEAGLLGLSVPEQYGGGGSNDFRFNAILNEELAQRALALASAFQIHVDIATPYVVELAGSAQRESWLPKLCAGEYVAAIAMSEPRGGSDLAHLSTSAARDGAEWVVNGSKTFVTNGASADLVILAVRTGPEVGASGVSLLAVETTSPGLSRGKKLRKIGQHEAETSELFFQDVRVPEGNLLGEPGQGFRYLMERLPQERLSCAISNVAHARAAFETTLEYAKERRAFARVIGSFQANKFHLAEMVTELDVAQTFVDRCVALHVEGRLAPVEAAKAKWWTSDVQNRVLDGCVQLFGGYGYMEEYPVARAWADARVTRIWSGTNEIMKEIIGRSMGLGSEPMGPPQTVAG